MRGTQARQFSSMLLDAWCSSKIQCNYKNGIYDEAWEREKKDVKDWVAGDFRRISVQSRLRRSLEKMCATAMPTEWNCSEEQAGFKKGYTTTSRVMILKSMEAQGLRRSWEPVYCLMIDFSHFFDTLRASRLSTISRRRLTPSMGQQLAAILENLCESNTTMVDQGGRLFGPVPTDARVAQGLTCAPMLASLVLDSSVGPALKRHAETYSKNVIPVLHCARGSRLMFADDLACVSRLAHVAECRLQEFLNDTAKVARS